MASPPWYRQLDPTQWLVLLAAAFGWFFDAMDQRLFILARGPAMAALAPAVTGAARAELGTYATALFIAGWATGGLIFGILGDRLGRVRTMLMTILIYSVFTGLSAAATNVWDFGVYRFLTGLGVGGEFAAGVALVAEVLPTSARPGAMGFLQIMAILGTLLGTLLGLACLGPEPVLGMAGWRFLFLLGGLPALLLFVLRGRLSESQAWKTVAAAPGVELGDLGELLGTSTWRRRVLAGMALGLAGQLGIWGAGTWTPELIRGALGSERLVGTGLLLKDLGSCIGIWTFAFLAARCGRRPVFAVFLVLALMATGVTFHELTTETDVYLMMPVLGFCCWSLLGGYAIYFPELFPTRLRSTGVGFCYNVARYLTALGVLGLGTLTQMFAGMGYPMPLRQAAMTVGLIYLVGLMALPFLPETKGQALPV